MADTSQFQGIKLNLRGTVFYTNSVKFKAFPDSRLAKLTSSTTPYHANKDEIYFDRNPALFHYILDIYDKGTLHLPSNVCSSMIKGELDYWQLRKDIVAKCCLKYLYQDDDDVRFFFVCLMSGTIMYHAELWSSKSFENIFASMWWAVVTLSSVGYGDVVPETVPGQVITVAVIIFGLLLIAIPFVLITSNYGSYYTCYDNILRHMEPEEEKKTNSYSTAYAVKE
ncbi:hypothetical protein FSP39_017237 [Pinctada imbricata]|uniref:Uncharacterized protein n=1 Tax=Pinctada imbricata TaxID=66713 RepID=A0AA88XVH4_PINIB|nr:hypothetical protein FSP39_017237 [Pinctada imbricata]